MKSAISSIFPNQTCGLCCIALVDSFVGPWKRCIFIANLVKFDPAEIKLKKNAKPRFERIGKFLKKMKSKHNRTESDGCLSFLWSEIGKLTNVRLVCRQTTDRYGGRFI
jgi:hypothetical protein